MTKTFAFTFSNGGDVVQFQTAVGDKWTRFVEPGLHPCWSNANGVAMPRELFEAVEFLREQFLGDARRAARRADGGPS